MKNVSVFSNMFWWFYFHFYSQDEKMSTNIDFCLSAGNERCNELYRRKASTTIIVCTCILIEYGPMNKKHIIITESHAIDIYVCVHFEISFNQCESCIIIRTFFCKKIIAALIKLPTYVATEIIEKKIDVFF